MVYLSDRKALVLQSVRHHDFTTWRTNTVTFATLHVWTAMSRQTTALCVVSTNIYFYISHSAWSSAQMALLRNLILTNANRVPQTVWLARTYPPLALHAIQLVIFHSSFTTTAQQSVQQVSVSMSMVNALSAILRAKLVKELHPLVLLANLIWNSIPWNRLVSNSVNQKLKFLCQIDLTPMLPVSVKIVMQGALNVQGQLRPAQPVKRDIFSTSIWHAKLRVVE